MRRLLRMSIEGFKTFAGRTDLELGPGLTAVVGPNGSGKSNLIDAIAWAVGSRSWKSLRGDGMDDVLFHGVEGRPPAPSARVTLSFENEDRLLGIDFSEVTVTRELVRGAGSRVLLNGAEARVRDVQAVLSGTGLAGGFSLIRQGVVDRLVLSAPQDVGRWVEESANLAAYRIRKQEASDRLRKVEAHASEADRKSASLRRELGQVHERAARARVRRELEARRDALRAALAQLEHRRLREALDAVDAESGRLRLDLAALESERRSRFEARARIERDLEAGGMSAAPNRVDGTGIADRLLRIRAAGGDVHGVADRLASDGPAGWPHAAERLDRIASTLREVAGSAPEPGAGRLAGLVAELRGCAAELERLEREIVERTAALSGRACERARLEERMAALGDVPAGADFGLVPEAARAELEETVRRLAGVGPVDETAEAREREVRRELEELAPILQDLAATRTQLASFIRRMNEVTSVLFEQTLARVDARFREYFGLLFQGGDARLDLLPADEGAAPDPLGAAPPDVEVRVKLPRKPETSLSLLSGGERSLAGLALVLALATGDREEGKGRLLILDEVDAALDESNAARLASLLRELQRRHQILCVTHNRLTMHQASRLVGVASGASSVSSLVKVDLARLARDESAA